MSPRIDPGFPLGGVLDCLTGEHCPDCTAMDLAEIEHLDPDLGG